MKKTEYFINKFNGEEWVSIEDPNPLFPSMDKAQEAILEILDTCGKHTPVRIRDYWGGVVLTNEEFIGK